MRFGLTREIERLCLCYHKYALYSPSMATKRIASKPLKRRRPARRGRPPVHSETWSKVSVVLFDRQIVRLDRLASDIRQKTGHVVNRAALIRAVIDGLFDSDVDIKTIGSEQELRGRIAHHLRP
jgi:hypothetical protein